MTTRGQYIWKFTVKNTWSYHDPDDDGDEEDYSVVAPTFDKAWEKVKKIALSPSRKFSDDIYDDDGHVTGKETYIPLRTELIFCERKEWLDG